MNSKSYSIRKSARNILWLAIAGPLLLTLSSCEGQKEPEITKTVDIEEMRNVSTPAVTAPAAGMDISGTVTLIGQPPPSTILKMGGNPECRVHTKGPGGTTSAKDVLVTNGLVQNVFIYIKEGLKIEGPYDVPKEPLVIGNTGCLYEPRVAGALVGQDILLLNNDPTLHNIHAHAVTNKPFNVGLPVQGSKLTKRFDQPEIMVSLKCDLHSWMQGWIGVLAHPFFDVSKSDGTFTLKNVPPGTYVIEAWHERFGTQSQVVHITDSPATISFSFNAA